MKNNQLQSLFFLIAAILVANFCAFGSDVKPAAGILTGKVLNSATGEELTGARILIKGSETVTYSEADGSFSIDLGQLVDRPENFELVVTLVSFESAIIRISSDGLDRPALISLSER